MIPYLAAAATVAVCSILAVAGTLKFARPQATLAALDAFAWRPLVYGLGLLELALAVGVALAIVEAQLAAAALLTGFAIWHAVMLARGHRDAPCPCLAGSSRVGPRSLVHAVLFAAAAAWLAVAPAPSLTGTGWLAVAAGALALACVVLALIAWTLAREVATLRADRAPRGALEIEEEGPPLGSVSVLIDRFAEVRAGAVLVAVFTSPGCSICERLRPAVEQLAREVPLEVFDEEADSLAWHVSAVPGSPYAIAFDHEGTVLAKGTFNTEEQLRSIPSTAFYRYA